MMVKFSPCKVRRRRFHRRICDCECSLSPEGFSNSGVPNSCERKKCGKWAPSELYSSIEGHYACQQQQPILNGVCFMTSNIGAAIMQRLRPSTVRILLFARIVLRTAVVGLFFLLFFFFLLARVILFARVVLFLFFLLLLFFFFLARVVLFARVVRFLCRCFRWLRCRFGRNDLLFLFARVVLLRVVFLRAVVRFLCRCFRLRRWFGSSCFRWFRRWFRRNNLLLLFLFARVVLLRAVVRFLCRFLLLFLCRFLLLFLFARVVFLRAVVRFLCRCFRLRRWFGSSCFRWR